MLHLSYNHRTWYKSVYHTLDICWVRQSLLFEMPLKVSILKTLAPALKFQTVFRRYINPDQSQPKVCKNVRLDSGNLSWHMPNHDQPCFVKEIFFMNQNFLKQIFFFIPRHRLHYIYLKWRKSRAKFCAAWATFFLNDILFFHHYVTLNERGFF